MSKDQKKEVETVSSSNKIFWLGLAVIILITFGIISFVVINKPSKNSEDIASESNSVEKADESKDIPSGNADLKGTVSDSVSTPARNISDMPPVHSAIPTKPEIANQIVKTAPTAKISPSGSNPVLLAKNLRPVNADSLTGPKRISAPPEAEASAKAKREKMFTEADLAQIPPEIANEKPESIGQAVLPDGTLLYIVYNNKKKPSKVVEISKSGAKTVKTISPEGNVDSIESNGKKLSLEYKQLQNNQMEITFKDQQNNVAEKRLFNSQGLLIQQTDEKGTVTNYGYGFDNGEPINYTKANTSTGEVTKGNFAEIEDLQYSKYIFSTEPSVKTLSYEHDNEGRTRKIIENKGMENEIVREFNEKQQISSIHKKREKITYLYQYDQSGKLDAITVVSPDGSKKVVKSTDPEFNELIGEIETFNPVEFGQTIQMHENMMKYRNENALNQQIMNQIRYKNLPTAKEIQGAQPFNVNAPNTRGFTAPQRPASVPKATSAPAGIRR